MNSKQRRKQKKVILNQLRINLLDITSKDIADGFVELGEDLGRAQKENDSKDKYIRRLEKLIIDASKEMHDRHQLLLVSFIPPKDHKFFTEVMHSQDWE